MAPLNRPNRRGTKTYRGYIPRRGVAPLPQYREKRGVKQKRAQRKERD